MERLRTASDPIPPAEASASPLSARKIQDCDCLRPHAIADAPSKGSRTGELFGPWADEVGISLDQMLAQWGEDLTLLGRLPTLAQVADAAAFLASDRAGAITGAGVDLSSGAAVRNSARAPVGVLD